jgi:hypothetical protein
VRRRVSRASRWSASKAKEENKSISTRNILNRAKQEKTKEEKPKTFYEGKTKKPAGGCHRLPLVGPESTKNLVGKEKPGVGRFAPSSRLILQ